MDTIYNEQVKRGKKIVLLIISITNIYYLVSFLINIVLADKAIVLKEVTALLIIITISFLFYRGFIFAKWLTLVFFVRPIMIGIFYLLEIIILY